MLGRRVKDGEVWDALHTVPQGAEQPPRQGTRERAEPAVPLTRRAVKAAAKLTLPVGARRALRDWWRGEKLGPSVGEVRLGDLRRLTPISRNWGFDRGQPVDRYYIENFLAVQSSD